MTGICARILSDVSFLDNLFPAIVAAFATNSVVNVPCATVRTDSQCRDKSFVVCTTFRGAGMRLSSFRMCHCSIVLIILLMSVYEVRL